MSALDAREEALNNIYLAGEDLTSKLDEAQELRNFLDDLVLEADQLGVPKAEISRVSGLSRQTIYSILLRARAGRGV